MNTLKEKAKKLTTATVKGSQFKKGAKFKPFNIKP